MRRKLGEILVRNGAISTEELDLALEIQQQPEKKHRLGAILMQRGSVTEDALKAALAEQERDAS